MVVKIRYGIVAKPADRASRQAGSPAIARDLTGGQARRRRTSHQPAPPLASAGNASCRPRHAVCRPRSRRASIVTGPAWRQHRRGPAAVRRSCQGSGPTDEASHIEFLKVQLPAECGALLGDAILATAILDRLLHHREVFAINGPSCRLRNRMDLGPGADMTS